jgi:mannose-6-phosphate isomerase-like protein (cupin superfamily)
MADYTVVNLVGDVENMAPKFGMDGVEARFARKNLELEKSGVSYIALDPDVALPFGHRHGEQEEVYVVLEGGGTCKLGEELVELTAMDAVRIAPQLVRSFRSGPDGARLLLFGAPNTENKDVEMVPDFWDS